MGDRAYLGACRAAVVRQRRVRAAAAIALISTAVVAVIAAVVAVLFFGRAEDASAQAEAERVRAEVARDEAVANAREARISQRRALALLARARLSIDPVESLKLALAAWPEDPSEFDPNPRVVYEVLGEALRSLPVTAIIEGDGTPLSVAAISPDGRTALTGTENGEIRLYDADTGRWLRTLDFAEDRSRVVAACFTETI